MLTGVTSVDSSFGSWVYLKSNYAGYHDSYLEGVQHCNTVCSYVCSTGQIQMHSDLLHLG